MSIESVHAALNALRGGAFLTEEQLHLLSVWGHSLPEHTVRYVGRWQCRRSENRVFCSPQNSSRFCGLNLWFEGSSIGGYGVARTVVQPLFPQFGINWLWLVEHGVTNRQQRTVRAPLRPMFELRFYMLLNDIAASM